MTKKAKKDEPLVKATVCSFCEKPYVFPCNGKRYDCANAVWLRSKGTIDMSRMSYDEIVTFRESGKKVPDVAPNVNRQRPRLEERKSPPVKAEKKKKRVRL